VDQAWANNQDRDPRTLHLLVQVDEAMLSERQCDREEVDQKGQNEHQAAQLLGADSMEYL